VTSAGRLVPYVFHRNGVQILSFYKAWKKALKAAGCPGRRPHDLRRTAPLSRAGVPERVSMQLSDTRRGRSSTATGSWPRAICVTRRGGSTGRLAKAFSIDVDYAQLHKIYAGGGDGRYSPAECIGTKKIAVTGDPDPQHISTSYVERANLTMRMSMRRFTRLTNAFSRKTENHAAMISLFFMYYNFCRVHQTLRVTPAMEAGITDRVCGVEDIVALLDQ
jgi:hypothetical protein